MAPELWCAKKSFCAVLLGQDGIGLHDVKGFQLQPQSHSVPRSPFNMPFKCFNTENVCNILSLVDLMVLQLVCEVAEPPVHQRSTRECGQSERPLSNRPKEQQRGQLIDLLQPGLWLYAPCRKQSWEGWVSSGVIRGGSPSHW